MVKRNQDILQLIIGLLVLVSVIFISKHYVRRNEKFTAWAIIVSSLIVFSFISVHFWGHYIHKTRFDKEVWIRSKWKPEKMTKTLVREKTLIGMTSSQVKSMLGEGIEENSSKSSYRGVIYYLVENDWKLILLFNNDKVVVVELRLPYLGV